MPHACKFPLGRTQKTTAKPWTTELIKPVSEMVKYLDVEEVYTLFREKVMETRQKQSEKMHQQALNQLKDDLKTFNIANHMKTYKTSNFLNIKRVIYRSITLFVSALGQFNDCFYNNVNFAILEELNQKGVIDNATCHDLSFAVAIACHIRLYQYMRNRTQEDTVTNYSEKFFRSNTHNVFLAVATKEEFVKFFSTVLRLQMVMTDDEIHNINKYFDKSDVWPNVAAKYFMGLFDEAIYEGEKRLLRHSFQIFTDMIGYFHVGSAYVAKGDISGWVEFMKRFDQPINFNQLLYHQTRTESTTFYMQLLADLIEKQLEFFNRYDQLLDGTIFYIPVLNLKATVASIKKNHHKALRLNGKSFLTSKPFIGIEKRCTILGSISMLGAIKQFLCLHRPQQALHYSYELLEMLDLWLDMYGNIIFQQWLLYRCIAFSYKMFGHLQQALKYNNIAENFCR